MPMHKVKDGYKFGKSGKLYRGKGAKKKVEKQARVKYTSGYKEKKEEMIKGDVFTSPIEFAIDKTLKTLGDSENDRIIAESLKRSKKMWEAIRIYGLSICGMTYEQFCEQFEKKKNVIFLSGEELEKYNKFIKIMDIL